jgi:hypothetical protein
LALAFNTFAGREDSFLHQQRLSVLCGQEKRLNPEVTEILRALCVEALNSENTEKLLLIAGHWAALRTLANNGYASTVSSQTET